MIGMIRNELPDGCYIELNKDSTRYEVYSYLH
jgi:hypothetical protein